MLAGAGAAAATVYVLAVITSDVQTPAAGPEATRTTNPDNAPKIAILGPEAPSSETRGGPPPAFRWDSPTAGDLPDQRRFRAFFAEEALTPTTSRARNAFLPMLTPAWEDRLSIPERRDFHNVRSRMDEAVLLER